MLKKYYLKKDLNRKKTNHRYKWFIKITGISLLTLGIIIITFYTLPVFIWHIIFKSYFAQVKTPIPPPLILTPEIIHAMEREQTDKSLSVIGNRLAGSNDNWLKNYKLDKSITPEVDSYLITISKLEIYKALVSTKETDPSKSLVQHAGTPLPPKTGNTVIFGHSTLPYLFDADNYSTIFANAHNLRINDEFIINLKSKTYKYRIIKTLVTSPDDLSVLNQDKRGSYITIITCTPPGTVWKRLIIKAKLISS